MSDRFHIPHKLYGRDPELAMLMARRHATTCGGTSMSNVEFLRWLKPSVVLSYGAAVLSAAAALIVARWMKSGSFAVPELLLLWAIMFSAWFGGVGPGLLAAVLCALAFIYYFAPPLYSFAVAPGEIPGIIVFVLSAIFVGAVSAAQRRAVESLSRTNAELQRSKAFLAEGQKISHTGSWCWNIPTGKLVWSEEHYRIFGFEPEETEPTFNLFLARLYSEDRPVVQQILDKAIRARSGFNCEFRIALPDGSIKHIQGIGRPVVKPSGDIDEFIGTTMEITERKRAEEALRKAHEELERRVLERTSELQQSNRQLASEVAERQRAEAVLAQRSQELARSNAELEQLAYVASHDLQEPLRMVASYLQLLEQRYGGRLDADAHEFIGFAVDGARRMQALIEDLLAYSRVGSSAKPLQPTDCAAVMQMVLRSLRRAIEESGAQIQCGALPAVMGDAAQLAQLFQNLIANAIKFRGGQAPRIAIRAEPKDGCWRFAVQDNGIGIAPEYFDQIFVMFQRLNSRSTYSGTGIGLAICKKIVERHGGRIWVESAPEQGAVFQFTLPQQTGAGHE
jgi:PAS domain S-box-containing protein